MPSRETVDQLMTKHNITRTAANNKLRKRGNASKDDQKIKGLKRRAIYIKATT